MVGPVGMIQFLKKTEESLFLGLADQFLEYRKISGDRCQRPDSPVRMIRWTKPGKLPDGTRQDAPRKGVSNFPPRIPERLEVGLCDVVRLIETSRLQKTSDPEKQGLDIISLSGFPPRSLGGEKKWDGVVFVAKPGGDPKKQGGVGTVKPTC